MDHLDRLAEWKGEGLSPEAIAKGEKLLGKRLPDAYKALLRRANGYRFVDCVFFRAPSESASGVLLEMRELDGIWPNTGVRPGDLVGWNKTFKPPPGTLTFGHAPDGSFLLHVSGAKTGCVAYEHRVSKRVEVLAPSLDDFLAGLRARSAPDVVAAFPIAPIVHASSVKRAPKPAARSTAKKKPFRVFEGKAFPNAWIEENHVVRDVRAIDCTFAGYRQRGDWYAQFEHIELVRPKRRVRLFSTAILRDVTIEGEGRQQAGEKTLSIVNVLCDRVKLVGGFRGLFFRNDDEHLSEEQRAFAATFYDDVDWALDIRDAQFRQLALCSVPGHLVLRDPERHALILTERLAADDSWKEMSDAWSTSLELALEVPEECHFLITGDSSKAAKAERAEIAELRAAGFVD